ncbi:hypothetical protein QUB63_04915 [Microcoleus sp. ARI1-B5]|uniref:hypothetical protein n=1 Tax=unclassified Microcoleus TaxID=2642155 RepID=UPI002FD58ECF
MTFNLLDRIGNWNPQLFREIKGRLKMGNIAIASALSLCGQLLLFMYFSALIVAPPHGEYTDPIYRTFCTFNIVHPFYENEKQCVRDALGNFAINWPVWWIEIFMWLSILSVLALLVAGTYMLVSDLDKEERRGTLNFIRLSPQSAKTIFLGKILGVPILLYLATVLTVPLHLYAGLAAQIPLNEIFCFYTAVAASCALFYSSAMLFGLTTSWLGGFQPWLASATVFVMFWISGALELTRSAWDLLTFLSPIAMLRYLLFGVGVNKIHGFDSVNFEYLDKWQWFYSPVGTNIASGLALSLLVCGTGTYWMWQGWQRRFPNPSATVLSKRQSYLLVICCQPIILGFALQSNPISVCSLPTLLVLNLLMFLALIAALTSDRQSLYDWARYRQQIVPSSHKLWRRYPLLDLIWSEKSPAVVAIAINFLSSVIILTPWALLEKNHINGFWGVISCLNLILIYAAIAQLFLFAKTRNQEIWAACTVGSALLLPPLILSMLLLTPEKAPLLWLSSTFGGVLFSPYTAASGNTIWLFSILSQWSVLVLLNLKLRSQLKLAGESASKALLKA